MTKTKHTFETTYGGNISTPVTVTVEAVLRGRQSYVKTYFASRNSWHRTVRNYTEDQAMELAKAVAKRTAKANFPSENSHGERMWRKLADQVDTEIFG